MTINKHNLTKNIMWEIVKLSDNLNNDFERSHDLFRGAFIEGFPWELLKVLSGPPHVIFTWRHFGTFTGTYEGRKGQGEVVEMFGLCRVAVNGDLKITKLEVFFDPDSFLLAMEGKLDVNSLRNGHALIGDTSMTAIERVSCPFAEGPFDVHPSSIS